MKKTLLTGLALGAFVLAANSAFAGTLGGSGIVGSRHDLSEVGAGSAYGVGADDDLNRVCIYCHAPHSTLKGGSIGDAEPAYYPLWNRPFSTITSYSQYDSGAATPTSGMHANATNSDTTYGDLGQPGSVSKLCLSCHDGSVATNVYGSTNMNEAGSRVNAASDWSGPTDIDGGIRVTTTFNVGGDLTVGPAEEAATAGDLSNHHPVGFDYTLVAAADSEIAATSITFPGTSVSIGSKLYGAGNTEFECVTCHDVHNSENATGAEKFLWTSDASSNFCCTCHVKCN